MFGFELLESKEEVLEKYGNCIIHQCWAVPNRSDYSLPKNNCVESWIKYNPTALHILWNDADNLELIKKFYPEYLDFYNSLYLFIHKLDFVRLLYLHCFGGIYVDIDYECKAPLIHELTRREISIVESPLPLETVQNSLMCSKSKHNEFWLYVVREIISTFNTIQNSLPGSPGYGGSRFFHKWYTRYIAYTIFTSFLSGPSAIDRTISKHNLPIHRLSHEYYRGIYAYHYENGGWVFSNLLHR